MRSFHRIVGIIVAAQIALWVATGLLFNVKYRYDEAYETLRPARQPVAPGQPWAGPAEAAAAAGVDLASISRVELVNDHRGPLYLFQTGGEAAPSYVLASATTGERVPPLDAAGADAALRSAVQGSPHAARYGAVQASEATTAFSALLGRETPAWRLSLATGPTVTVNAITSEIAHTSWLNTWIDLTYRVHYMQYTPWQSANIAIVSVFSLLVFLLIASGVRVFFERGRRYGYESRRIRF